MPFLHLDCSLLACGLSCFDELMVLWKSQMEDHTSDWLRVVPISSLGQTMNGISAGKEVNIGLGEGRDKYETKRADI
nr:hypothetical protein [Tanacetum cinerariifolium]